MGTSIRNETTKESSEIQRSNKADRIPTVPPDGIVLKTGSKSGPWTGEKNVPPPPPPLKKKIKSRLVGKTGP